MWSWPNSVVYYILLIALIRSVTGGTISSRIQSVENDSTYKRVWTLVVSLTAGETITEKVPGAIVKITRDFMTVDIPLFHVSSVNPKRERYIHNDHCGIYASKGSCKDSVGWNRTLCCHMPLTSKLYRGTGEHCLDANPLITYQVYESFNYSIDIETKGSVSILTENKTIEYPVKWNSNQLTYSVEDVFHSSYMLTRDIHNHLPDLYFFFESQHPLHEGLNIEHMNWFTTKLRREVIDRLFITPDEWIRQANCLQPQHFLTRTQLENPEDQYANFKNQKLGDYLRMSVKNVRARRNGQQLSLVSELDTDNTFVIIEMSITLPS